MDRISELPDDILVHILSMLMMKEAGGTSVLSKRWRCVWAYVPVLNFDATKILEDMEDKPQEHMHLREVEGQKYLRWVDQVVTSHKAPTLHEFRVRFDFDEEKHILRNIDNWVRCAMDKRVKRLEMDFSNCMGGIKYPCYTFPNLFPCNTLTSLEFASVNVTGEVLERFLQICQCLEYLSVKYSESLVGLKVAGPLLNLKYLQVYQCFKIKQLVISAPNLTSFCYFGRQINVHFKSIPKVAKISIGNEYTDYLADNFSDFSSCAGQIEELYLMTMLDAQKFWKKNIVLPEFTRLEILEVKVYAREKQKLYCFYSLIKACPALKKFVLKLIMIDDFYKERKQTLLRKREARPHSQLKNVEIIGFNGHAIDLEFAISLIAIAVSLETMTIDPCLVHLKGTEWEFQVTERVIRAREQAQQLRAKLRPGTDLIIR